MYFIIINHSLQLPLIYIHWWWAVVVIFIIVMSTPLQNVPSVTRKSNGVDGNGVDIFHTKCKLASISSVLWHWYKSLWYNLTFVWVCPKQKCADLSQLLGTLVTEWTIFFANQLILWRNRHIFMKYECSAEDRNGDVFKWLVLPPVAKFCIITQMSPLSKW